MPPTEPFAVLPSEPAILALLVLWGIGEAVVLPVVPDVLIGFLLLAAPRQIVPVLAAAIGGGVIGSVAGWWLLRHRPRLVERVLAVQPGLGRPGLEEAEGRLRQRGSWRAFAQIGPGLPLKAYLHAQADVAPATGWPERVGLAFVNRLARLGPVAIAFALASPLVSSAPSTPAGFAIVYGAAWTAFYLAYWIVRDSRRRSRRRP